MKVNKYIVACFLVISQILFGGAGVVLVYFAGDPESKANPVIFAMYRNIFASIILTFISVFVEGWRMPGSISQVIKLTICGSLLIYVSQISMLIGIFLTSAVLFATFQPTIPVITAVLVILLRLEPFPRFTIDGMMKIGGIVAATVGGMIVVVPWDVIFYEEDEPIVVGHEGEVPVSNNAEFNWFDSLLGYGMLTTSVLSFCCYMICQQAWIFIPARAAKEKKLDYEVLPDPPSSSISDHTDGAFMKMMHSVKHNLTTFHRVQNIEDWADYPISLTLWGYLLGLMCLIITSVYYMITDPSAFNIPAENYIPLSYYAVINASVAYLIVTWANVNTSASFVTAFWPLQLVTTGFLAFFFLDAETAWTVYLGGGFICAGLFLVVFAKQPNESKSDKKELPLFEESSFEMDTKTYK